MRNFILNIANKLTLLRIFLILPIMIFLLPIGNGAWADFVQTDTARIIASILFVIAALTDFIDGKIARSRNMVTNFGKLMDPIADKLLVIGGFIAFAQLGRVHGLIVIIILARELLVTGIRQLAAVEGVVIAAGNFGKWKAAVQMITLVYLLFEPILTKYFSSNLSLIGNIGNILIGLSLILTIFSGFDYFIKHKDLFSDA